MGVIGKGSTLRSIANDGVTFATNQWVGTHVQHEGEDHRWHSAEIVRNDAHTIFLDCDFPPAMKVGSWYKIVGNDPPILPLTTADIDRIAERTAEIVLKRLRESEGKADS